MDIDVERPRRGVTDGVVPVEILLEQVFDCLEQRISCPDASDYVRLVLAGSIEILDAVGVGV